MVSIIIYYPFRVEQKEDHDEFSTKTHISKENMNYMINNNEW